MCRICHTPPPIHAQSWCLNFHCKLRLETLLFAERYKPSMNFLLFSFAPFSRCPCTHCGVQMLWHFLIVVVFSFQHCPFLWVSLYTLWSSNALTFLKCCFFFSALLLSLGVPAQVARAGCGHTRGDYWHWWGATFECYQGNLTSIPDPEIMADFSQDQEYLEYHEYHFYGYGDPNAMLELIVISNNPIQAIERSDFQGLSTVRYLSLSRTEISELPAYVFAEMPNLAYLTLIFSPLTTLHADSLRGIPNLRMLTMYHNRIKCLPLNVFSDLPNLSYWLDLAYNEIEYIAPGALNGMSTQKFFLEGNKLQCLHADSLQGIVRGDVYLYMMYNELKTLNEDSFRNVGSSGGVALSGNVMECCSLGWLKEKEIAYDMYSLYYYSFYSYYYYETEIHGPNCTDGSDWDTLDPDNLPPCTGPIDTVCAESLNIPGCPASPPSPPDPVCTQTGTYLDCSSKNLNTVPYYIDPATTRINLADNNIGGNYFWNGFSGLSSVIKLDMRNNNIDSLSMVFSGMPNLRVLVLKGNKIGYMTSEALQGVPKLRSLDLGSNVITDVPADFFASVPDLTWLILSDNNIGSLDSQLFQNTPNLQSIYLHKNPLGIVCHNLFRNLASLRVLNLMKTDLNFLPMNLLHDLVSLEWLDLRGNNIRRLTSTHMQNIPLSPQSPFILEIGDNPLVCCPDMLFLKNAADAGGVIWWKNSNQYSSPPQCADTPWHTLNTVCTQ